MFNRFGLLFKIVIKRNRCNVRLICEPSKHIAKTAKAYPEWWWRERWKQLSSSTMRRYKNLHFNEMCTAFFVCTRSVVNGTKIGLWFVIVVSCFFFVIHLWKRKISSRSAFVSVAFLTRTYHVCLEHFYDAMSNDPWTNFYFYFSLSSFITKIYHIIQLETRRRHEQINIRKHHWTSST